MAQLNSRGTVTRNRWDFYEASDGYAFVFGSVASGGIGAYFANNSTGAAQIDIFALSWFASAATVFGLSLLAPPFVAVPLTPSESFIHALQPDRATTPGVVGMYSSFSSPFYQVMRYSNSMQGQTLAPIMGSYFFTLPPGWGIAIGTPSVPSSCELSMTVWFQEVTDNISPAR